MVDESDVKKALNGREHPLSITLAIGCLKVLFFVYDVITYIPFKIFADPAAKLERSKRIKAEPENTSTDAVWTNVHAKNGLLTSTFEGIYDLGSQWEECVRRYGDLPCMGTREVLKVHKEKQPNGKIFEKWQMGDYQWRTYSQVDKRVNMIASGLASLGQQEKEPIILFAETREEWMTTALACMKMNFPIATIYATLGEDAVEYAINEVGAKTIFTSETLISKVKKAMSNGASSIENIIFFDSVDPASRGESVDVSLPFTLLSFDQLLSRGEPHPVPIRAKKDDLALIMYTSGTTGNPKGVMISHGNIVAATVGQGFSINLTSNDRYIGYLPLAHILEVCAEMVGLTKGVRIGYSSAQTLFDRAPKILKGEHGDCWALQPTLMACVPAVMDRIFKAVIDEVNANSEIFKELFKVCYERKRLRYEEGYSSFLLNKLVFNRIGKLLGGNVRQILSGGAPLSPETQRFMNICFCCPVVQGYGLTETCGGGTIADVDDLSTGTVGPPLPCCEILLQEWAEAGYSPKNTPPQGEILISGPNVAHGYFKNEEKTKEEFVSVNGKRFFATGDIGEFREDGSLKIIDRKKDLLKLAHGEYISLGKVETNLLTNPLIDNVCVYGDSNKSYLVALVVPNQKNFTQLAEKAGADTSNFEKLCVDKKAVEALQKELSSYASAKLQRVEIPQKLFVCHEPWTPTSGLLTEALKLKRKNIEKAYRKELDELYK
uniref:long-chain-fatty-acid--CoA ligase n=1 Tax=Caenorhabditis japonica TaxID=281687 RepID=A0A8R1DT79_CAEJA